MRLRALGSLALADLNAARGRSGISLAGIALGVAVLMITAGLGLGARELVMRKVVRELPVDLVEVIPKSVDLGLIKLGGGGLLGGPKLDAAMLERLTSLPEVVAAYPKLEVSLPLGAQGGKRLFGRPLYTDLFMIGVPKALLEPEVGTAFGEQDGIIPVVISTQLLEIYNNSVAASLGTPQLTADTLKGFEFDIVIGHSLMLGNRGAVRQGVERARIVGVSQHALRLGVTVPMATARRLLATYGDKVPEHYASVLLRARSPSLVPALTERVAELGLSVDETARKTSDILTAATVLASLVGILVLLLAALNIAHSFYAQLSERRRELAILRAVGARQRDLVALVLTQAAILGALGGVLGAAAAYLGALLVDWGAARFLPAFPFKPESFFLMPPSLIAFGIGAAVAAALLGATWPAISAARRQVARSLADG